MKEINIFKIYKKGKNESNRLAEMDLPKKVITKSIIFSIIFTILLALPFVAIIASLLTVYSTIRSMFWVTLGLVYIFLSIVYASGSTLNVVLLKNYIETEEVLSVDTKSIFIFELLNPLMLVAGLIIGFMIYYMAS